MEAQTSPPINRYQALGQMSAPWGVLCTEFTLDFDAGKVAIWTIIPEKELY